MADISIANRHLNLALIEIGEALTEIGNQLQRGKPPGSDYGIARLKLLKVIAALNGEIYTP